MNRDRLDFGNERIGRLFRAMFFPTLVAMVFNSVLNICDGMFVGHGVGPDGLAAINIVAPFFLICTGVGLMFGIGASVIASIRLAEDNVKAARIIMTQAYIAGAVIFGAVILCSLVFTRPVLYLLGCSPALEDLASDYLLWLLPGLFFFYLQCVGMMLVRLDGSPRYAMSVQVVAAILNIFLDWLMVFPLGMGIAGASIATSFSCIVGGLMVVVYFLRFSSRLKFYRLKATRKSLMLSLRNVGYMAKIGFATFVTEAALGIMIVAGNFMFMSMLGEDGVAAYSVGCYLFPVIFSISNAVAQSAQPIVSFNFGAARLDRVAAVQRVALATAVFCGGAVALAFVGCPQLLVGLFLPLETAAARLAVEGFPLFAAGFVCFVVNLAAIGYYQSLERVRPATFFALLRGFFFLVPAFVLLPRLCGTPGIWLAMPLSETLTMLALGVYWRRRS